MRIGDRVHALALRAFVAAGPLRHADKEALIRREPIDRLSRSETWSRPSTPCTPGSCRPDRRHLRPSVSLPLILMSSITVYSRILIRDAFGALFELGAVLLGPPVVQIALGVELAALVVEAVG